MPRLNLKIRLGLVKLNVILRGSVPVLTISVLIHYGLLYLLKLLPYTMLLVKISLQYILYYYKIVWNHLNLPIE